MTSSPLPGIPSGPGPATVAPVLDMKPFGCSSRIQSVDGPFQAAVVSEITPLVNTPRLSNVYGRVPVGANAFGEVSCRSWAVCVLCGPSAVIEYSVHSLVY